jgi:putative FmdB family regulatory protein
MPTYEYRCPDGHEFERFFRKISDAQQVEVACPTCGKPAERRMSAGAGLVFKGSGFYLTDYGKNAHRGDAGGSGGEAKGESTGGGASSGDAKPGESGATKAEPKAESKPAAAAPPPKSSTSE